MMNLMSTSQSGLNLARAEQERRRRRQARQTPYEAFKARYRHDPIGFMQDCVAWPAGQGLAPYQIDIVLLLMQHKRESARGPHGLGKTAIAALLILWFALTRDGQDWKAPTTASAWRQLSKFLWPEIHKWARRLRWDIIGRAPFNPRTELQTLSLKLSTGEAFALASDTPELIEGVHADHLFYLFDEAKTIPGAIFDAAEGAFSNTGADDTEAYALAISTPGAPHGRFADIHHRKPGYEDWHVRAVTLTETIAAGRVSQVWADARKRQWGEESAVYQNRVEGKFAASAADGVIPLAWVELANERWYAWDAAGRPGRLDAVGLDVGGGEGGDQTTTARRYGMAVGELDYSNSADTMETTGRLVGILRANPLARAVVDVIGIGAGLVHRVREVLRATEQDSRVTAFNAAEGTDRTDSSGELGFANKRAAAWWNMRELLDPANGHNVALPPDDILTGDLTAPRYRVVSGGKILIESKKELRDPKRLGRSTDAADCVIQSFWDDERPAATTFAQSYVAMPARDQRGGRHGRIRG